MVSAGSSTSSFSASWPVAGDSLRRGAGESTELPTEVKEVLAMFGGVLWHRWVHYR
jgi:hypothetical protein